MIRLACPICGKEFGVKSAKDSPNFPFCSNRCRLIDLDNWLEGRYRIGGSPEDHSDEGLKGEAPND